METTELMESKINEMANHLCDNGNLNEIRQQHMKLFGIATKSKDKKRLAAKIAKELMFREMQSSGGNGTGDAQVEVDEPNMQAGPNDAQKNGVASDTLVRVKNAWDEAKALKLERKEKKAAQTKVIGKHTEAIDEVLNSQADANERVNQFENHWRIVKRARDKRSAIAEDYKERIKAATTVMESEFNSVGQYVLPFDTAASDDDDDE